MIWQTVQSWDLWLLHGLNGLAGNAVLDGLVFHAIEYSTIVGYIFLAPYWYFWFADREMPELRDERRQRLLLGLLGCLLAILVARGMADLLPFRARPLATPDIGFK